MLNSTWKACRTFIRLHQGPLTRLSRELHSCNIREGVKDFLMFTAICLKVLDRKLANVMIEDLTHIMYDELEMNDYDMHCKWSSLKACRESGEKARIFIGNIFFLWKRQF